MPLYAFACPDCGHKFEVLTAIGRDKDVRCPKCGAEVKRVYEGKCAFGAKASSGGGHGCSGNCAGCGGCHGH